MYFNGGIWDIFTQMSNFAPQYMYAGVLVLVDILSYIDEKLEAILHACAVPG